MFDCTELEARGWTCVTGITDRSNLLELARSVGKPVPSPTGALVRELAPTPRPNARKGTLSDGYGLGSFPLHTDTAFWPLPSRYIVLRVRGDTRRPTTIVAFAELFREQAPHLVALANRSVWRIRIPSISFYCSMRFRQGEVTGWRYDSQCMSPANGAAAKLQERLGPLLSSSRVDKIAWTGDLAVVLCNWRVLHGRGPSPTNETSRILERVYVE